MSKDKRRAHARRADILRQMRWDGKALIHGEGGIAMDKDVQRLIDDGLVQIKHTSGFSVFGPHIRRTWITHAQPDCFCNILNCRHWKARYGNEAP